ncbi:MAG: M48 family metalloprotease [Oscillatoria sp. SIO1A7]|nr:M48 family metalloprotease [Oscillatoria sp. SIO1A7]
MTMTIEQLEQFDSLVQRIERYARQKPAYYRFRVGLLAALGYAYVGFVFLLLCAIVWALRLAVLHLNAEYLIDRLNWITFLLALGVAKLFFFNFPRPKGLELNRQEVPELFDIIDEMTAALSAPKFHHILLTDDLNAGVFQRPRFGFFGWQENYLILGLPLMQALSPGQFRAVVAHELGHLSGNDHRFSGWIYRIRKILFDVAEKFQKEERGVFFPFKWFFSWYGPFFNAYSFVLARAHEYEADRCAVDLAGANNKAEALIQLEISSAFLQKRFWPKLYKKAASLQEPPEEAIANLLSELRTGISPQDASKWLALGLAEKTDNDDTHPSLSDRLGAIGYQTNPEELPAAIEETAAMHFFGDKLENFAASVNLQWQKEIAKTWQKLHAQGEQQERNLQVLEEKSQNSYLTVEQSWKLAYLTWKEKGKAAATPLFQAVLDRESHHPRANYQLGQILLEQKDSRGIGYLETAIAQDPEMEIAAGKLLYSFHRQEGQLEKAEEYRERSEAIYEDWKRSRRERGSISYLDRFLPHNLPAEEMEQIAEQLSHIPEIREAYLVRKAVAVFPEKPLYVLGIIRRFVKGTGRNYKYDPDLIAQIETELNFSGEVVVLIFQQHTAKLKNAVRQVESSLIYHC